MLNNLLFEKKIRATDLAREICVPQPTIHRLMTGKSPNPHRSTLEPIANFFNMTVEQLTGEHSSPAVMSHKENKFLEIPLINWHELDYLEHQPEKTSMFEKHIAVSNISKQSFATRMNDSSMEPLFPKNCILILDPEKEPTDRSYVLVKFNENRSYIFRQILIDGEDRFLKPLNPELHSARLKIVGEDDQIIASLVEARHIYE